MWSTAVKRFLTDKHYSAAAINWEIFTEYGPEKTPLGYEQKNCKVAEQRCTENINHWWPATHFCHVCFLATFKWLNQIA